MGKFSDSLKANSDKILARVNNRCYAIARELFSLTVEYTPPSAAPGKWAQGLLINQWYPSNGSGFSSSLTNAKDKSGSGSLSRIKALSGTEFLGRNGSVTLANNLSYAYRAEKLGWPTPQWTGTVGPYAMVAKSLMVVGAKYK